MKKLVIAGVLGATVLLAALVALSTRRGAQPESWEMDEAAYGLESKGEAPAQRTRRVPRAPRKGPAAELAAGIAGASSTTQALSPVREALARGGLSTADLDKVVLAAHAPASASLVSPLESFVLASEARRRATAGTLTMRQLAEMLHDFGFPFAGEQAPDLVLAEFFRSWVEEADRRPDDVHSFTPRFLAEMALRQAPPVDLTDDFDAEDVRLTLLELQLFAAAFDRLMPAPAPARRTARWWLVPPAQAYSPCEDAKKWLGDQGDAGKMTAAATEQLAGIGMGKGVEKMAGADAGKAMQMANLLLRFLKLVNLYRMGQVEVTVQSDNPMHKPLPGESMLLSEFQVRAGVSKEDWEEYKKAAGNEKLHRALKDCLGIASLPLPVDAGDFAKDVDEWTVVWRAVKGLPQHARFSDANVYYLPGNQEMKLRRDSPYSASASLFVELTRETGAAHRGPEFEGEVVVRAEARTASPPSLGTLVNTVQGGAGDLLALIDALSEIATGWFQEMVRPKGYGVLQVRYHQGKGGKWNGTIRARTATRGMEANVSPSGSSFASLESELVEEFQLGETIEELQETTYLVRYRIRGTVAARYSKRANTITHHNRGVCPDRDEDETVLEGAVNRQVLIGLTHDLSSGEVYVSTGPTDKNDLVVQGYMQGRYHAFDPRKQACATETNTLEGEPQQMPAGTVSFLAMEDPNTPGVVKGRVREPGLNLRGAGYTQTSSIEYDLRRAD